MNRHALTLALILASQGIGYAQRPNPEVVTSVTIERTWCFGSCPVYKATLKADGTISWFGEAHVGRLGTYKAAFWEGDFAKLSAYANRLGFWKLKPNYRSRGTCQASCTVTIITNQRKKTVDEYGSSGPDNLWAIQVMIDGMVQSAAQWEKVEDPVPVLRYFKRFNANEFVPDFLMGGTATSFQRCYRAKIESAKVVQLLTAQLDPQLWKIKATGKDWSGTVRTSWEGRKGSIYEGWNVDVQWNAKVPETLVASDLVVLGYGQKGWTSIGIFAAAKRQEIDRVRELFRYTFGVP